MYNTFTKIFGGKAGSETYDYPIFNVYNDIFGESIFSGKGVINISVFNRVLNGILGNGSVLSHDIIEGSFLRTILVSDVVFYDKTPKNIFCYVTLELIQKLTILKPNYQNIFLIILTN